MSGMFTVLANFLAGLGRAQFFLLSVLAAIPSALMRPRLLVQQLYMVGVLSLIIIVISGSFVGMVLALQGFRTLVRFGAEESLGVFVALVIVRELGPVVTALLFAGRAGSALAAEIGLMKATDQLSAMEMMAVDPVRRVCAPRFIGGVIALPLLAVIFSMMGIYGGQLVGVALMGVDAGQFWSQMRATVELRDITEGVIKSGVFGVACSAIAVYEGYHAVPTAEGVGRATTRTVVTSSVAVLVLDYMLTAVLL